ncbi:hypothetical protein ISCGN_011327 [Ixodes scapularis]
MEYKILLPPLPNGKLLENSLILHGDPSARPYRLDDFGRALKKIINPNDLASLGAFQYNHVWLLAVRSAKEKNESPCHISSRVWEPSSLSPCLAEHRNVCDVGNSDSPRPVPRSLV